MKNYVYIILLCATNPMLASRTKCIISRESSTEKTARPLIAKKSRKCGAKLSQKHTAHLAVTVHALRRETKDIRLKMINLTQKNDQLKQDILDTLVNHVCQEALLLRTTKDPDLAETIIRNLNRMPETTHIDRIEKNMLAKHVALVFEMAFDPKWQPRTYVHLKPYTLNPIEPYLY